MTSAWTAGCFAFSRTVGKTTCAFFRPGTNEVLYASTHLDPDAAKKQEEEIEFRQGNEDEEEKELEEH